MNVTRRAVVSCIAALLIASASWSPAQAASGQPVPTVEIGLIIKAVAPTLLQVDLRYTCLPSPTAVGDVSVLVTQSAPVPAQGQGGDVLTCDGAPHDLVVTVVGGPAFSPGPQITRGPVVGNVLSHNHRAAHFHVCGPGHDRPCGGGQLVVERYSNRVLLFGNRIVNGRIDEDPSLNPLPDRPGSVWQYHFQESIL